MIPRVSIALLVIALLALAGLQYHWIGEISVAERQRLEDSVRESSNRFAGDFGSEIRSLTTALDFRGGEPDASAIASRYRSLPGGIEKRARIQLVIAQELIGDAMKFIGAGLGNELKL